MKKIFRLGLMVIVLGSSAWVASGLVHAAPAQTVAPPESSAGERGEPSGSERRGGERGETNNSLLNVNTASLRQLQTLPGVGPRTAAWIVSHRPYRNAAQFRSRNARYISPLEWSRMARRVRFN